MSLPCGFVVAAFRIRPLPRTIRNKTMGTRRREGVRMPETDAPITSRGENNSKSVGCGYSWPWLSRAAPPSSTPSLLCTDVRMRRVHGTILQSQRGVQ